MVKYLFLRIVHEFKSYELVLNIGQLNGLGFQVDAHIRGRQGIPRIEGRNLVQGRRDGLWRYVIVIAEREQVLALLR